MAFSHPLYFLSLHLKLEGCVWAHKNSSGESFVLSAHHIQEGIVHIISESKTEHRHCPIDGRLHIRLDHREAGLSFKTCIQHRPVNYSVQNWLHNNSEWFPWGSLESGICLLRCHTCFRRKQLSPLSGKQFDAVAHHGLAFRQSVIQSYQSSSPAVCLLVFPFWASSLPSIQLHSNWWLKEKQKTNKKNPSGFKHHHHCYFSCQNWTRRFKRSHFKERQTRKTFRQLKTILLQHVCKKMLPHAFL